MGKLANGAEATLVVEAGDHRIRVANGRRCSNEVTAEMPDGGFVQIRAAPQEADRGGLAARPIPTLQWERVGPGSTASE
jgi:hypothetical protein